MKVLALDFDGVVCDSLREVFATALATYETMTPESPLLTRLRSRRGTGRWHGLELVNDPVMVSFESMMPLGNRAEDFGVSLKALDNLLELTDQGSYDTFYSTVDREWMARFHRGFYEQRDAARAWALAYNTLGIPVAAFGLLLRDSEYKGSASYPLVRKYARGSLGEDPHGYRAEFLRLVSLASDL